MTEIKEFQSSQQKMFGENASTIAKIAGTASTVQAYARKKYDSAVVVGRFQPLHEAHIDLINHAISLANVVMVVVGSAFDAATSRNPFSYEMRKAMIEAQWAKEVAEGKLFVEGLEDYTYRDAKWDEEFRLLCANKLPGVNSVWVTCLKDAEAVRAHEISEVKIPKELFTPSKKIDATDIRRKFFAGDPISTLPHISADVKVRLDSYRLTEDYNYFAAEQKATDAYKESWASAPFPPIFVAVDGLVVWHDFWGKPHFLLIRRKSDIGNGRIALPGGYLDHNEYVLDAAKREVLEETGLTIDSRFHLARTEMFDKPDRSTRGRMITHCHQWITSSKAPEAHLPPEVKGADDAAEAFWMPIDQVYANKKNFFSDHYYILTKFYREVEDFKR